jgi:hypothetical protein
MKPAWDKLMTEYKGHKTTLIADVDCTAAGKPLCDANGVSGYPTIKHGDPAALEDYSGGRDADSLSKFAATLKPLCSPSNMDLCDEESKASLEALLALDDAELTKRIEEGDKKIKDAESHFSEELEKLQAQYQELVKTRDDTIAEVKSSGLGQLKSVKAFKASAPKDGADGAKDEL